MPSQRPIAIIIVSILTFLIVAPYLSREIARDPLEVSFVYPSPDRPKLELGTYMTLTMLMFVVQPALLIFSIMVGIGLLKRQRWSWFSGIALHAFVVGLFVIALIFLPPYTTNDRVATLAIGIVSLYLLSKTDVRRFLKVIA
jgi:cell division protein FtsW (lipid II flippase)